MQQTGGASLLRKVNASAIVDLLRKEGPLPRVKIARRLRLSLPTVSRICTALIEADICEQQPITETGLGRRPALVAFNPRAGAIIAILIGQEFVAALCDLQGEILSRSRARLRLEPFDMRQLVELIGDMVDRAAATGLVVRAVGVAAPHDLRTEQPLAIALQAAAGLPVVAEKRVNLCALGEGWRGAGQGVNNLVYLLLDRDVEAAVVIGGALYSGEHGAAGAIGNVICDRQALHQEIAHRGRLQSILGSQEIAAGLRELLPAAAASSDQASDLAMLDQAAAAEGGTSLAVLNATIDC